MTTVRIRHIRALGYCSSGARHWFKEQGLSWADFLENGLPIETVEAIDDHLAQQVAAIARSEDDHGR